MDTRWERLAADLWCARVAPDSGRARVAPYPGRGRADLAAAHVERAAAHVSKRFAVDDAWARLAADHAPKLAAEQGWTGLVANTRSARLAAD